uniref:Uncharacterized protein n=1 Tax=Caenorhabditis japonica TaxID=281687 RepID=A0A8R1EJ00_CAEJA
MRPTSEGDGMVETQTTEKRSDQWKIKDADPAEYSSRCPSARKLRRKSSVSDHSSEKMEDSDSEMKVNNLYCTARGSCSEWG